MAGAYNSSGAWVTTVTSMDSTQKEELGILRFEGSKVYRYVRATAATIEAGSAVTQSGTGGTTVVKAAAWTSAAGKSPAGIAETAFTTSYYGWITVFGPATALVDTGVTAGDALFCCATAGALAEGLTVFGTSGTTGSMNSNSIGEALDTGVIAGSTIFVRCL